MHKIIVYFTFLLLPLSIDSKEIVLDRSMNYGISGENDETEIEFKNLKK